MIRKILRKVPLLYSVVRKCHVIISDITNFPKRLVTSISFKRKLKTKLSGKDKVWYFCVPVHNNLGDYAQYLCIKKWIMKNYPERNLIEIPTIPMKYDFSGLMSLLKQSILPDDLIVFQSGYTSSDLHPDEFVHRKIARYFKNKILFFPQTVKYSSEKEAKKTAEIYNNHGNITFLARDKVSYETAKQYFKNVNILLMPDIVTTLIGKKEYKNKREGIAFCIRCDSEKKYADNYVKKCFSDMISDNDIWTDTTLKSGEKCSKKLVEHKISQLSHHKITITDRFHGTIFSLAASTPVIVLKTTDHKVVEGANWFTDEFSSYIKVASTLEEAHEIAKTMLDTDLNPINYAYFEDKFYCDLKEIL